MEQRLVAPSGESGCWEQRRKESIRVQSACYDVPLAGAMRPALDRNGLYLRTALDVSRCELMIQYPICGETAVFSEEFCDNPAHDLHKNRFWLTHIVVHSTKDSPAHKEWLLKVDTQKGVDGFVNYALVKEENISQVLGESWEHFQSPIYRWMTTRHAISFDEDSDHTTWLDSVSWSWRGRNKVSYFLVTPSVDTLRDWVDILSNSSEKVVIDITKVDGVRLLHPPAWFRDTPSLSASDRVCILRGSLERCGACEYSVDIPKSRLLAIEAVFGRVRDPDWDSGSDNSSDESDSTQ